MDGIAPAIDKVGPPAPGAPEAQARAPTMEMQPNPVLSVSEPAIAKETTNRDDSLEVKNQNAISKPDGSTRVTNGPGADTVTSPTQSSGVTSALHPAPKPVEITSVPQTPLNGGTPAGASPRPELNIPTDPTPPPTANDDTAAAPILQRNTGPTGPTASDGSVPDHVLASSTGVNDKAEMTGALPPRDDKPPAPAPPTVASPDTADHKPKPTMITDQANGGGNQGQPTSTPISGGEKRAAEDEAKGGRLEKKAKVTEPVEKAATGSSTNGGGGSNEKKTSKVKKIKDAVMGRTARKTRSQGPVEGATL